jgi:hypothetical protein
MRKCSISSFVNPIIRDKARTCKVKKRRKPKKTMLFLNSSLREPLTERFGAFSTSQKPLFLPNSGFAHKLLW